MAAFRGNQSSSSLQIPSSTSIKKSNSSIHKHGAASEMPSFPKKEKEGGGGDEDKPDKKKSEIPLRKTKSFEFKADKMRVRLTPIEDYERKLVFHLDSAPGRVITRLERLMGSDKVCLMDHDWMRQLENRLDEEDEKEWVKRNHVRIMAERERYRKLAIDGYIPVPDSPEMQDIYKHPVYRVNKIIKRLGKFDYNALLNPKLKMPPLTLINPFEDDDSGKSFKTWPGHNVNIDELERGLLSQNTVLPRLSVLSIARNSETIGESRSETNIKIKQLMKPVEIHEEHEEQLHEHDESEDLETTDENFSGPVPVDPTGTEFEPMESSNMGDDQEDEETEEDNHEEIHEIHSHDSVDDSVESLDSIRRDLKQWEPFQAKLLKMFDRLDGDSETAVAELFETGDEIVGVYNREVLEAEEACIHLAKVINAHANNLEIPVNAKAKAIKDESGPSTDIDSESEAEEEEEVGEKTPPTEKDAK